MMSIISLTALNTGRATILYQLSDGRLATGETIGTVRFWNLTTAMPIEFISSPVGTNQNPVALFEINTLNLIVAGGTILKLYNVAVSPPVQLFAVDNIGGMINDVVQIPGGNLAVSLSTRIIRITNPSTGALISSLSSSGEPTLLYTMCDGRLAAAYSNREIRIWNLMTSTVVLTLAGHSGAINGLQQIPATGWIVSASSDSTVIIWYIDQAMGATLTPGQTLMSASQVKALAIFSTGQIVGVDRKVGALYTSQCATPGSGAGIPCM